MPMPALPTPVVRTRSPPFMAAHAVNRATQMPGHRCQQGYVFLQGKAAFKRGGEQYGSGRRRRVGGGRRDLRVLQHRPRPVR
jgi:hypothetical protein